MSKRTIINLILIAAVVALTVYVKKNPVRNVEPVNFANIAKEQVETIVVQRADQEELIFEKSREESIKNNGGGWIMTSPLTGNVIPEKLNLLLKFLDLKSRHQQKVDKDKQLARYDLDPPNVSLFINDQQFDFGSTNDFNKLRYVLHDNTIHSVKDITHHLLMMDAEAFLIK